jgi:regulator of protease activity HflC (stomatin/prohibitin superfamily)
MGDTREDLRGRYDQALDHLRTQIARRLVDYEAKNLPPAGVAFAAAAVDLVMDALEKYLVAAASDRLSAERDRASAAADRKSAEQDRQADRAAAKTDKIKQDADRAAMNFFTKVIALATIVSALGTAFGATYGAFHPPKAPVFNVPQTPASIIQPVPVNVTLTPSAPERPLTRQVGR